MISRDWVYGESQESRIRQTGNRCLIPTRARVHDGLYGFRRGGGGGRQHVIRKRRDVFQQVNELSSKGVERQRGREMRERGCVGRERER